MPVFNERFKDLLAIRKITPTNFAKQIGVSKQAVAKYINDSLPKQDKLSNIAKILKAPVSYFKNPSPAINTSSPLFFRAKSKTSKKGNEYAETTCNWIYEIVRGTECFEEKPKLNIPVFDKGLDISEKAQSLRDYWGLGVSPVKNLTDILEKNGIVISSIKNTAESDTDSYSQIINGLPIVVLNNNNDIAARQRFNAAHELGHLILHSSLSKTDFTINKAEYENEAYLFASMFLLPPGKFNDMVESSEQGHLIELKEIWNVSISAILYRCEHAKILLPEQVSKARKQMYQIFGRKWEPKDDIIPVEIPHLLSNRIKNHIHDKDSFDKFYDIVKLPLDDIEILSNLEDGYLSRYIIDDTETLELADEEKLQLSLF